MLDNAVLHTIDKAIAFPLIFELTYAGKVKVTAAHKRPSGADGTRWVVGDYFEGDWLPETAPRAPLPLALNMGILYEQLLTPLVAAQTARLTAPAQLTDKQVDGIPHIPESEQQPISLEARIAQAEAIKAQAREVERIKARLSREKQFNKRVAINAELRAAKQKLERLMAGNPGAVMKE